MLTNFDLSLHIFAFLKQAEVNAVVVCAGARNASLVLALRSEKFKIYNFFEERSAAYFALGLSKATDKPVAVVTTSGTAVAELLPATIEAAHQGIPLVLISADRPKSYRGTGSPQSIDQVGIFSNFVEKSYDLDVKTQDFQFDWSRKKPIHLNVCYDEPIVDVASKATVAVSLEMLTAVPLIKNSQSSFPNPLIIVGEFAPEHRAKIIEFIVKTKAPVYAESLSVIKEVSEIETYIIHSSDQLVKHIFKNQLCQSIIRIGRVPTLRFWRDLEYEFKTVPVANYTDLPFTGLSRPSNLNSLKSLKAGPEFPILNLMQIKQLDIKLEQSKEILFYKYPLSEQNFINHLSATVGADSLYLGNSQPIRYWDQFAKCESHKVNANRGANGIDGQVSTYLGWSELEQKSYCLVGDLTAMYDLAALGFKTQLNTNQRNIIVLNNFGGQIFSRIFNNSDSINSHKTHFQNWAQMWEWSYLQISTLEDLNKIKEFESAYNVIEILPNKDQTELFWSEWDQLCQEL